MVEKKLFIEDFYDEEITLDVVQGLGDIFWVYQKFSPYFAKINFNILYNNELDKIQCRSLDWLKCFPKVNQVQMKLSHNHPWGISQHYFTMEDTVAIFRIQGESIYCCNRWIEDGVRLEDIDPGAKVEWGVPLISENCSLPFSDYSVLYVSGTSVHLRSSSEQVWDIDVWIDLLQRIYKKYSKNWPVVVLGSDFDSNVAYPICDILASKGIFSFGVIGQHPKYVINIIKNAKFMLGHQSGLNVIADNLNIPQIMVHFPHLKPMLYAWCKKENINTLYYPTTFDCSLDKIVGDMNIRI